MGHGAWGMGHGAREQRSKGAKDQRTNNKLPFPLGNGKNVDHE